MPQNFYEVVWIFIVYAFFGWCTEVAYAALNTGKFVNRGFLNGPYCPIYGCGVTIVVAVLTPLKENIGILFLGSFFLTTILEYLTGLILEKAFHNKWWDYSKVPFNIHGYVCLKFSILWGLACVFVMRVLHPGIYKSITLIPHKLGVGLLIVIMTAFCADCGVTVAAILNFNKRLRLMNEIADKMHRLSDEIGENIYEGVTDVMEKSESLQETTEVLREKIEEKAMTVKQDMKELPETARIRLEERTLEAKVVIAENLLEKKSEIAYRKDAAKREYEELKVKYKSLLEEKNMPFKRLLKAFPDMVSMEQNEMLKRYKKYFNIKSRTWEDEQENDDEMHVR